MRLSARCQSEAEAALVAIFCNYLHGGLRIDTSGAIATDTSVGQHMFAADIRALTL